MTLEAFLLLQKEQYESVLIEEIHLRVDSDQHRLITISNLKEEHHPIAPDILPILNQIWEAQYLQGQESDMRINRELGRIHRSEAQRSKHKPHRPYALKRNRVLRSL